MSWVEAVQVVAASTGVIVAGLVAFMPYARRPRLSIEEDADRSNSRVEAAGLPHVRLLVANAKRRRAAEGTRILVEGYTASGGHAPALTTLGHPSLDWPSTGEAASSGAVTVFAGGARPITLGYFIRPRRDTRTGQLARAGTIVRGIAHFTEGDAEGWYLRLALAFDLDILDDRDKLPPVKGGYIVRLLVGADDGAARTFLVHIDWDGDPSRTPDQVLASALDRLAVTS